MPKDDCGTSSTSPRETRRVGAAMVRYHVSRDQSIPEGARLVYLTEAIGVFKLLGNCEPIPKEPMTIVIADEVHERTMFTQMIIGMTRLHMEVNSSMMLVLMSATVEELESSIPGCQDIGIDQHQYTIERFYMSRNVSSLENTLVLTAKLIVQLHHEHGNVNRVKGVEPGKHCDNFLVFCPGKPQMRFLANLLIRWQENKHNAVEQLASVAVILGPGLGRAQGGGQNVLKSKASRGWPIRNHLLRPSERLFLRSSAEGNSGSFQGSNFNC